MNKLKTALLSTAVLSTAYLSPSVLASQLDEATVSKTDFNSVSKTFDITAQQSTNGKGIKQIDVAIWSEENGQDDLKWYSANAITEDQASVQFHLANHGNRAGNYVTHVYTTYLDGSRSGLVLDNTKITPSAPQVSVKDGVIQLTTEIYAPSNGQVKYAIWSEENGQDDLRWYDDNGKGLTQIALKNHKGYGKYFVHTYLSQNGQMIGINGQEFTVDRPELSYQITKVNGNSFDVLIHNVPEYITSVSVPTWSNVNGQDDIKWYSASKIGEGSYTYTFYAKNHNFESGHYNVHVYGVSEVTHSLVGLATTSGIDLTFNQNLTAPTVTVQNHDADKGTLQVKVSECTTSKVIQVIRVAAWSESD
ncbi:GBS Bsp-like repeat-containing protein [Streptococcus alactolyticus]|uniref:GBS Bsp-like repeat-containing protein n=1 Tax=Streptococcus alactolyticus TaxID=29389 RepID=UPI001EF5A737|nr:GBS Bsp-like repeat-containing protein [Streptococcus alactolyticus]